MAGNFGGRSRQDARSRALLIIMGAGFFLLLVSLVLVLAFYKKGADGEGKVVVETVSPESDVKMVDVLVPVNNIDSGNELTPRLFKVEQRPQYGLDDRVIKSFEQIRGFYSRSMILAGQPLYQDHITNVKPNTVEIEIPAGYRAVTISVTETASVYGWAQPNSHVDVAWISRISGKPTLTTIVEDAIVLSVDRITGNSGTEQDPAAKVPSTVTLSVKADDADRIHLAEGSGTLKLSLRNPEDIGGRKRGPIDINTIMQGGRNKNKPVDRKLRGTIKMDGKDFGITEDGEWVPLNED